MQKHNSKSLAAKAIYTAMFMMLTAHAYATSNAPAVANAPVGVVNNAPINLSSPRVPTAQRARTLPDHTSAAAYNQSLQKQQARQAVKTKIKSPFPENFSSGFSTVKQKSSEDVVAAKPEQPYVPPRPAMSSVPETQEQATVSTGTPYTTIKKDASPRSANAPKSVPYTVPSAYNGLSRR